LYSIAQNFEYAPDQLIVKFREAYASAPLSHPAFQQLEKAYGLESSRLIGNTKAGLSYLLAYKAPIEVQRTIKAYLESGLFEFVEPNYTGRGHGQAGFTPNDPFFNLRQWSHHNSGNFALSDATEDADIDTDLAWDISVGAPEQVIAILDSGMKLDHPEVDGRIWVNEDELANGFDTDNNAYIDDTFGGWDFANNDNDPTDDHGHGTNVAGIAVATGNNGIGYAGMNWNAQIMICKILDDDNFGFYSWWADAIYYAVDNGADVINMSVGGNGASFLLEEAIEYAYDQGVPVVVSVGNQNDEIQYPARYQKAFAIGSTDADDTRSVPFFWSATSGSNFGPALDFVAPGNYIYGLQYSSNTNYGTYWGGTSQAAPHVAGLISLLQSIQPGLTIDEIRAILEDTSEDQVGDAEDTPGWDPYYGHGRINAYHALTHQLVSTSYMPLSDDRIHAYPNPIDASQPLILRGLKPGSTYHISKYDAKGTQIHTFVVDGSAASSVSFREHQPGIYFLRISLPDGKLIHTEKVFVF
jgi:subtilisin family serine protease